MLPTYTITNTILQQLTAISEKLGAAHALHLDKPPLSFLQKSSIKTIQASLALAGNICPEQQVASLLEQKRKVEMEQAAQELWNTIQVYQQLSTLIPSSKKSFLKAHQTLLQDLTAKHLDSTTEALPDSVEELLEYIQTGEDPLLLKSCVVHCQLVALQPFLKDNGKMGRLWQTLILLQEYPVFEFLSYESLFMRQPDDYHQLMAPENQGGNCTAAIAFLLEAILKALEQLLANQPRISTGKDRLAYFIAVFKGKKFSRKVYREVFQSISSATASRDLKEGVQNKQLRKTGDKRLTSYQIMDGTTWRTAKELWSNKELRKGGGYELALEVCSNKDKTPIEVLAKALFELEFVKGPFDRDFEPAALDKEQFRSVGYIEMGAREVPFVLFFISDEVEGGSNWLDISIYTGMYEEALGEKQEDWAVHAQWNKELEALFFQMVQQLNFCYPIRLGLLGFEVSGLYNLEWLKENEFPKKVLNPSTFFVNQGETLKGENRRQVTFIG